MVEEGWLGRSRVDGDLRCLESLSFFVLEEVYRGVARTMYVLMGRTVVVGSAGE